MERFLDFIKPYISSVSPSGPSHRPQTPDFPTLLYIFQRVKSQIPEASKRYPFRAGPPRIGHHNEYPSSPGLCLRYSGMENHMMLMNFM